LTSSAVIKNRRIQKLDAPIEQARIEKRTYKPKVSILSYSISREIRYNPTKSITSFITFVSKNDDDTTFQKYEFVISVLTGTRAKMFLLFETI
jgi:hypothetical protein